MAFPRIQRTFSYVTRDLGRVFYFVFVHSIQSKYVLLQVASI